MKTNMELPGELLSLVREYSKPVFAHWQLFNKAKRAMEPCHLEPLRKALLGRNAGQVSEALASYLAKGHAAKVCEAAYNVYEQSIGIKRDPIYGSIYLFAYYPDLTLEQTNNLMNKMGNLVNSKCKEQSKYRNVLFLVYGEKWDFPDWE